MKAMRVNVVGGPEQITAEEIPIPSPLSGEVRIRLKAVGVNYLDVARRAGHFPDRTPFTLGSEGAGIVDAVGEGVTEFKLGDRVAWCMHPGAYAEVTVVPVGKVVPLPEEISFEMGAAVLVQGATAHYLTHSTFPVKEGHQVLVHAAAGGVGLLLVQMAKRLGARVYGTVGNAAKAEVARQAGADETILYREVDFAAEVRRLTGGEGVHVVYDSVGKDTFVGSIKSLAPRGYMVSYGQASGDIPPIDPRQLVSAGSLFLTKTSFGHHMRTRAEILSRAADLFRWVASGQLSVHIDSTYPLAEAAEAHRRMESRQSAGKILLTV